MKNLDLQQLTPWILGVVLIGGSLVLAAFSNLLRDSSTAAKRPFSFARSQLLWWVLVITFCVLRYFGDTGELPKLSPTCLILLGIGVGTAGLANVIDRRQRAGADAVGTQVLQDNESENFLIDVLSDENGLSVHRLQALIFNIVYGVAFVAQFLYGKGVFPDYDSVTLATLGLSTAGYLGLKSLENNPASPGTATAGGDELPDVDPAAPPVQIVSG
jgi:hypothetical protein